MLEDFSEIEFYRDNSQLKERAWKILEDQVAWAGRTRILLACILLDIDHFWRLVDSQGASLGQAILAKCLARLQEVWSSKLVMSYGRDEFLIITPIKSIEDAMFLAEDMRRQMAETFQMLVNENGQSGLETGCSAGVALYPTHSNEAMALLGKAQEGLYLAKRQGRNLTKLPVKESMILKSNYYSQVQLERLTALARKTAQSEASLLREALDRFLSTHDT